MNSTSIYILVALHPIITLTNMPNTAMEATELLKEIQKHDSQQAFRSLYDMYYDRFFRIAFYYLQRDEWAQEPRFGIIEKVSLFPMILISTAIY